MPTLPFISRNEITGLQGVSRLTALQMMKILWLPAAEKWINTDGATLLKHMSKKGKSLDGAQISVGYVDTGAAQSVGLPAGEGDRFPTPSNSRGINPRLTNKYTHGRLRFGLEVQREVTGGESSWFSVKQHEMELARIAMADNRGWAAREGNRWVLGVIEDVTAVTANGDITVLMYDADDRSATSAATRLRSGVHMLRVGQRVTALRAVGGVDLKRPEVPQTEANEWVVASITDTGALGGLTVRLTNTAGLLTVGGISAGSVGSPGTDLDNALLVLSGSRIYDSTLAGAADVYETASRLDDTYFHTCNGLADVIYGSALRANIYGLAKATERGLAGIDLNNGGTARPWTGRQLGLAHRLIRNLQTGGGGGPSVGLCHEAVFAEIGDEFRGSRISEFVQKELGDTDAVFTHMAQGFKTSIYSDRFAKHGRLELLDPGCFEEHKGFTWQEERFVPDYPAMEVVMKQSLNRSCMRPHRNGFIDDISANTLALT
jgi:hypothetical protein